MHPLPDHPDFPPFPPIISGPELSSDDEIAVRAATALVGRHCPHNGFSVPGVLNEWGGEKRMRATSVIVSRDPINGVRGEHSLDAGTGLHIALMDEDGHVHGHLSCSSQRPPMRRVLVLADRHGRGWVYDPLTGLAERTRSHTSTVMREFILGGAGLLDALPFSGEVSFRDGVIETATMRMTDPEPEVLKAAEALVSELVGREETIIRLATAAFSDDMFSAILDTLNFPVYGGLIPVSNLAERASFDDSVHEVSLTVMRALRDAGLCAACPNNGPRKVAPLIAWDAFVRGDLDEAPLGGEERHLKHLLFSSPAFQAVYSELVSASVNANLSAGRDGGREESGFDNGPAPMAREEAFAVMLRFREGVIRALSLEVPDFGTGSALRGALNSRAYALAGTVLTPILADPVSREVLPVMGTPKKVRHMVLELPTGRLAMADWFRVPGFTESMESLSGEDEKPFHISYSEGRDSRAEAYFTKAGVAIVQVGNSSPSAYADTPGVWRVGRVDEDNDHFWGPDGDQREAPPEEAWSTCTDLWANTFSSPEAIVSVMMKSGLYDDESDAERALIAYCDETPGANIADLGVGRLHLYLPTGYAEGSDEPMTGVGTGALPQEEWREDAYILSASPLPVAPGLLSDEEWTPPRVSALRPYDEGPAP